MKKNNTKRLATRVNGDKMKTFPQAAHKTLSYWSGNSKTKHHHLSQSPPMAASFFFAQVQYFPSVVEQSKKEN